MPSPKLFRFYFQIHSEPPDGGLSIEVYSTVACNLISAIQIILHDARCSLAWITRIDIGHDMEIADEDPFTIAGHPGPNIDSDKARRAAR